MGSSFLATRAWSVVQLWALPFFLTAICAVSGCSQVAPPTANDQSDTIISVDVRLVVLHVSVRNKRGDIVSGLQRRNFRLDEDGQPQTIQAFHPENTPVAVGLVVDNSGSMTRKRPDVTAAAVAFARSSNPDDHMFVVNFNERPTLGLPDLKLFSGSAGELVGALLKPGPPGRTALYDAISDALAHVRRSSIERKALVVIGDGGDNASTHTLNQVLRDIARSDVIIYTIGLFDREDPDVNPRVLQRIANASGGQAFLPKMSAEAGKICQNIAKGIRTQYAISYSPSNQKFGGEYRTIKVGVTGDHGAKLQARTRAGYVASPSRTSSIAKEGRQ
jgi:Ca-activated chloride channel homolog